MSDGVPQPVKCEGVLYPSISAFAIAFNLRKKTTRRKLAKGIPPEQIIAERRQLETGKGYFAVSPEDYAPKQVEDDDGTIYESIAAFSRAKGLSPKMVRNRMDRWGWGPQATAGRLLARKNGLRLSKKSNSKFYDTEVALASMGKPEVEPNEWRRAYDEIVSS